MAENEKQTDTGIREEMPTVTTLLQRKRVQPKAVPNAPQEPTATQTAKDTGTTLEAIPPAMENTAVPQSADKSIAISTEPTPGISPGSSGITLQTNTENTSGTAMSSAEENTVITLETQSPPATETPPQADTSSTVTSATQTAQTTSAHSNVTSSTSLPESVMGAQATSDLAAKLAEDAASAEQSLVDSAAVITATVPEQKEATKSTEAPVPVKELPTSPPVFRKKLSLETLDIKGFESRIKSHKLSSDLKKLDFLGYFSTYFSEISFFEVNSPDQAQGVLGFGNEVLVGDIRGIAFSPNEMPKLFDAINKKTFQILDKKEFDASELNNLGEIGFNNNKVIGVFPILLKKHLQGVWICTGTKVSDFSAKETKILTKILSDISL